MGRSDSERAPVLSAMLPSVSAWRSTAAACRSNVADLTSPRAYAVTPGPDGTWPLDGVGPAERGLSRGWDPQNVASRGVGTRRTWPLDEWGQGVADGQVRVISALWAAHSPSSSPSRSPRNSRKA